MSDEPKPDPSPREMRMDLEAADLEACLKPIAKKLGMRIKVTHDALYSGFYVDCELVQPRRANLHLDEETMLSPHRYTPAFADMLIRELENLQARTFDAVAEAMRKVDARGRQYGLSDEDKHALHEMYNDACCDALRDLAPGRPGQKRIDKYRALMERLFR